MSEYADRVRNAMKPFNDLVVINAETTGRLVRQQTALVLEITDASVSQVKRLVEAESVQDAFDAQRNFVSDLAGMFRESGREQMSTLREAGSATGDVFRGMVRRGEEAIEEAGQAVSDAASEAAA